MMLNQNLFSQSSTKPNIVIFLADDLGYGSVGTYGAPTSVIRTPNIDALATAGRKFVNAYTPSSVCTPTRFAVLTGEYQWRNGIDHGVFGVRSTFGFDLARPTIAKRLQDMGYSTAAIGKWHLGYGNTTSSSKYQGNLSPGPNDIGFDYHFGVANNNDDIIGAYVLNNEIYGKVSLLEDLPVEQRPSSTNLKGQSLYNGVDYFAPWKDPYKNMDVLNEKVEEWIGAQSNAKPFFLYYATTGIHGPLTPEGRYHGKTGGGIFSDFIMELDSAVGKVVSALDKNGFTDNTIFIFTSDNGGHPSGSDIRTHYENINGPYNGLKLSAFEGGFRVPFIVKWPGQVPAGSTSDEIVNLVDIYASCMSLVGESMGAPEDEAPDSFSFYDALFGTPANPIRDHMIYTSYEGVKCIQTNGWKYIDGNEKVEVPTSRKPDSTEQLYHLSTDPYETSNIISSNSTKKNELISLLEHYVSKGYSRPKVVSHTNNRLKSVDLGLEFNNPVSGKLLVKISDKALGMMLSITDLEGKVRLSMYAAQRILEIPVSKLDTGVYIISIYDDHHRQTKRLLVQ